MSNIHKLGSYEFLLQDVIGISETSDPRRSSDGRSLHITIYLRGGAVITCVIEAVGEERETYGGAMLYMNKNFIERANKDFEDFRIVWRNANS